MAFVKKQREQTGKSQNNPGNKNSDANISIQDNSTNNKNHNNYKNSDELKRSQKLFIHPVRHVAKLTTPQRDVMLEPMQETGHFPGRANRKDRVDIINRTHRTVWPVVSWPQPNILTRIATSSLRKCKWQTRDHQKKIPPIPCVVWQHPLEISVESSSWLLFIMNLLLKLTKTRIRVN